MRSFCTAAIGLMMMEAVGLSSFGPVVTPWDLRPIAMQPTAVGIAGALPGDCNGDGVVDSADYATFFSCRSNPEELVLGKSCECVDFDGDFDVDHQDFAVFQNLFNPPPVGESCGEGENSCFADASVAGCAEVECCQLICEQDDFCCKIEWDELCATSALERCPGAPVVENNACADAAPIEDGTTAFSNVGATTDGPMDGGKCADVGVGADIWYCYTASCTGVLIVSLCGSTFDTTLAVYDGCACPVGPATACSDDDCFVLESRATLDVTQGQSYLIRVGGFIDRGVPSTGTGQITLICGEDAANSAVCAPKQGSCFEGHRNPGCDTVDCCLNICQFDPFCCDVQWDDFCAAEGNGFCLGNFESCGAPGTDSCNTASDAPGCSDADCCNAVCEEDPFCCLFVWDGTCANLALDYKACP